MSAQIKFNATYGGSQILHEDADEIHVPITVMREGIIQGSAGYEAPAMRKYESFADDVKGLDGVSILRGHSKVDAVGHILRRADKIGIIRSPKANASRRNVTATAVFHKSKLTPEELAEIKSRQPFDASIEFSCCTEKTNGVWHGQKYSYEELPPFVYHGVAKLPRGEGACTVPDCGFNIMQNSRSNKIMSEVPVKKFRTADGGFGFEIQTPDDSAVKVNAKAVEGPDGKIDLIMDIDGAEPVKQMADAMSKFNSAYQEDQRIRMNKARSALQESQEILKQRNTDVSQDRMARNLLSNQAEHLSRLTERWSIEQHQNAAAIKDELRLNAKQNAGYGQSATTDTFTYSTFPSMSDDSELAAARRITIALAEAGHPLTDEQRAIMERYPNPAASETKDAGNSLIEAAKQQVRETLRNRGPKKTLAARRAFNE